MVQTQVSTLNDLNDEPKHTIDEVRIGNGRLVLVARADTDGSGIEFSLVDRHKKLPEIPLTEGEASILIQMRQLRIAQRSSR